MRRRPRAARAGSGAKRAPQAVDVGQPASVEIGGEHIGEFGLAAAFVRQREQLDHDAAGRRSPSLRRAARSKVRAIGVARKELVAIDQVEQRHRLAAQRMDDVPVVDDMAVLAVAAGRPRGSVIRLRAAEKQVEPVVVEPHAQPMADQPRGHGVEHLAQREAAGAR